MSIQTDWEDFYNAAKSQLETTPQGLAFIREAFFFGAVNCFLALHKIQMAENETAFRALEKELHDFTSDLQEPNPPTLQ